jgi:histidinol-phosphatase
MRPTEPEDKRILETALVAAHAAGELLTRLFRQPHRVEVKTDDSIATEADLASEQTIRKLITEQFPDHTIIGEESGITQHESRFTWVIDPLDGTKNFLRGVPLFSVEIAILKDGVPQVGVSYLPMMGDLLWAIRGNGAFSNEGPVHVSTADHLSLAYVSFGNLKHFERAGKLTNLMGLLAASSQCRGIGDSWSFHLLAKGSVDVFVDARTAFWDIAALSVIIHEAGGTVTDLDGRPLSQLTASVLATNSHLHPAALLHLSTFS